MSSASTRGRTQRRPHHRFGPLGPDRTDVVSADVGGIAAIAFVADQAGRLISLGDPYARLDDRDELDRLLRGLKSIRSGAVGMLFSIDRRPTSRKSSVAPAALSVPQFPPHGVRCG